jgi:O-antigen/teichoic acid export membrane protein
MSLLSMTKETNHDPESGSLVSQTAWLTGAKIIALALSFMLPLALVRLLSQTEFGLYKQAFQILTTTLSLLGLQVAASVYFFMPREPDKKPQIALNVMIFYLLVGTIPAVGFMLFPDWVTLLFRSDELVRVTPLLGLAIMLWLASSGLEGVMLAEQEVRHLALIVVLIQMTKNLLLIGAALLFGSLEAVVLAAVIQGLLQCALTIGYLRFHFGRFWWPFDLKLFRAQVVNSLPYGCGSLVLVAQYDLHNYFVSHYFSPAEFAIYSVGCFQLPLLTVLVDSVDFLLGPEIARLAHREACRDIILVWLRSIRLLALFFVPTGLLLLVLRHEFIVALFTRNYLAAVPVFTINLLNLLLWMNLTGPILRAFPEFRYYRLKLYLILLVVMWFGLSFGIRWFGISGAVAAIVFVRALDVGITVTLIGQRLGFRLRDLPQLAPVLQMMVAATFAALVTGLVKKPFAGQSAMLTLLACSAVFAFVFLSLAFALGAIREEEKDLLRRLSGKFFRAQTILPEVVSITEATPTSTSPTNAKARYGST